MTRYSFLSRVRFKLMRNLCASPWPPRLEKDQTTEGTELTEVAQNLRSIVYPGSLMPIYLSLILILMGCSVSRPALPPSSANVDCIQKFIPKFKLEWYNTSVDVLDNHLSGLLLFKKMDDQSQRIVFTNEAGVKFFDFGFDRNGDFKVYHVLQKLNKKAVINTFRKDFELLLMNKARLDKPKAYESEKELKFAFEDGKETDYVVTNADCSQLLLLEKWGKKKMTEITFSGPATLPDSISIQHFNFRMSIKMRRLIR